MLGRKVDVAFFMDDNDEQTFWVDLASKVPAIRCIDDARWDGNGSPPLVDGIAKATGNSVTLWLPSGETVFKRGENRLNALPFFRSLLRDGTLESGRMAVVPSEDQFEFVETVVKVLRSIAKYPAIDLSGRVVRKFRVGPSVRDQIRSGELGGLCPRSSLSEVFKA